MYNNASATQVNRCVWVRKSLQVGVPDMYSCVVGYDIGDNKLTNKRPRSCLTCGLLRFRNDKQIFKKNCLNLTNRSIRSSGRSIKGITFIPVEGKSHVIHI